MKNISTKIINYLEELENRFISEDIIFAYSDKKEIHFFKSPDVLSLAEIYYKANQHRYNIEMVIVNLMPINLLLVEKKITVFISTIVKLNLSAPLNNIPARKIPETSLIQNNWAHSYKFIVFYHEIKIWSNTTPYKICVSLPKRPLPMVQKKFPEEFSIIQDIFKNKSYIKSMLDTYKQVFNYRSLNQTTIKVRVTSFLKLYKRYKSKNISESDIDHYTDQQIYDYINNLIPGTWYSGLLGIWKSNKKKLHIRKHQNVCSKLCNIHPELIVISIGGIRVLVGYINNQLVGIAETRRVFNFWKLKLHSVIECNKNRQIKNMLSNKKEELSLI